MIYLKIKSRDLSYVKASCVQMKSTITASLSL